MVGTPQDWEDGPEGDTPLEAARLNDIEARITSAAATADLASHGAAAIAHGATGAVVGTTNTQTLRNKTYQDPVFAGTKTGLAKGDVGLGSVVNADTTTLNNIPGGSIDSGRISDFVAAVNALSAAIVSAQRDVANGVAPLNASRQVPAANLPPAADSASRSYAVRSVTATVDAVVKAGDELDRLVESNGSLDLTFVLPAESVLSFPVDRPISWRQWGTGRLSFAAGAGATMLSRDGATRAVGRYAGGIVVKKSADVWWLLGDVEVV